MRHLALRCLIGCTALACTSPVLAFNPDEGASAPTVQPYLSSRTAPLPEHVVPKRYYRQAPTLPATVAAPIPAETAVALPVANPEIRVAPVAPSVARISVPPQGYNEPLPMVAPPTYQAPTPLSEDANQFSVGIEGYYSRYEEESVSMVEDGAAYGVSASYTHYFNPQWFTTLDARGSYGTLDYESISGTIDDIPQWEVESRLVMGGRRYLSGGRSIKGYAGLGTRYFSSEFKGKVSDLGALGYDRRIMQLYIPIGVTYEFAAYGLDFAPNVEIDPVVWGNVSSRLGTIVDTPPYYNIENRQHKGIGLRAEFMMGQMTTDHVGWQFGPFIRYWNIPDSEVTVDPNGDAWIEPKNSRVQAGATLKMLF